MSEETKNVTLYQQKDQEGNPVAPLVPERGIYDEDGMRLDDKLKSVNLKSVGDAITAGVDTIKKEGDTQVAEVQKQFPTLKHQIGLDKYKEFNGSTNYKVGDVVLKEGQLYKYRVDHVAGAWNPQEVYEVSMEQDIYEKLDEKKFDKENVVQEVGDSEDKVMSQKAVSGKLTALSVRVEIIPDSVWNDGNGTIFGQVMKGKSRSNMLQYHEDFQISEKPSCALFFGSDKTFLGKSYNSIVSSYSDTKYIAFVWDTIPDVVQYSFFLEKDTKANFDLINREERLFCKKGYRNLEGDFVPFDTLVSTDYIPIETNSIILLLKSQSGNIFPNLCYYDVNKKFVGAYRYNIGGIIDRILISYGIPSDARYITVNAEATDNAKVKIYDGSGKDVLYMDRTVYEPFSLTWEDLKNNSFVSNEFIPVTDGSRLLSNGGRMYRLQYYDSDKNLIVNSDITFEDGDVKGQDTSFEYGRFCDYSITIPNGYGIKYVKVFKYPEKYKDYVLFVSQSLHQLAADVNKTWKGKKLVTIGDSLTANTGWQQIVADALGLVWSYQETCNGEGYVNINDGTYTKEDKSGDSSYRRAYPMAVGGTTMRPYSINSIYMRMWDARYYKPDIIIIYAGENDPIDENSNPWGDSNLSAKELVESTTSYKENKISSSVNAMAAYKGMVEVLSTLCPKAKIYLLTCMRVRCDDGKVATAGKYEGKVRFKTLSDIIAYDKLDRFKRQEYVKAIGEYYGVPVIDLMNDCGATHFNQALWYDETAYDCTQVHPNMFGRKMMAKCIISKV